MQNKKKANGLGTLINEWHPCVVLHIRGFIYVAVTF